MVKRGITRRNTDYFTQIRFNKLYYGALSDNKDNPKGKRAITAAVTVKIKNAHRVAAVHFLCYNAFGGTHPKNSNAKNAGVSRLEVTSEAK